MKKTIKLFSILFIFTLFICIYILVLIPYANAQSISPSSTQTPTPTTTPSPTPLIDQTPPTPPVPNILATTTNAITLKWNAASDPSGISEYKIFQSNQSNGSYTQIGSTSNTEYTVSNLAHDTEYWFKVSACDNSPNKNCSALSDAVKAKTKKEIIKQYEINSKIDKNTTNANDQFTITYNVKNTGNVTIENFEIRVPFLNNISDVQNPVITPDLNRRLDPTTDFPQGFNTRSWVTNINPGEEKEFTITYTVSNNPSIPNGHLCIYTLPISWIDPAGDPSNQLIQTTNFRADIYINRQYEKSIRVTLPTLESVNSPIASVQLPSQYLFEGSKTTNLRSINKDNISKYENFTLENAQFIIEWLEPIDLSNADIPAKLINLDNLLKYKTYGIDFNIQELSFLAKKVRITLKKHNYVFLPRIKIDNEIKDLQSYNGEIDFLSKFISFEISPMRSFTLVSDIKFENPKKENDQYSIEIKVSNPKVKLSYSIDDSSFKTGWIDQEKGNLSIILPENDIIKLEVKIVDENNEEFSRVKIIEKTTPTPTFIQRNNNTQTNRLNLPINPLTILLSVLAIVIFVLLLVIGYIMLRKRFSKKKEDNTLKLDFATSLKTKVLTHTSNTKTVQPGTLSDYAQIGEYGNNRETPNEVKDNITIDLTALKNRYTKDSNKEKDQSDRKL